MGQSCSVASFRKRLYNRGYREISIIHCPFADSAFPLYFVSFREPVFGQIITGFLSEIQMQRVSCRILSGHN